jgi:hypothetical protein
MGAWNRQHRSSGDDAGGRSRPARHRPASSRRCRRPSSTSTSMARCAWTASSGTDPWRGRPDRPQLRASRPDAVHVAGRPAQGVRPADALMQDAEARTDHVRARRGQGGRYVRYVEIRWGRSCMWTDVPARRRDGSGLCRCARGWRLDRHRIRLICTALRSHDPEGNDAARTRGTLPHEASPAGTPRAEEAFPIPSSMRGRTRQLAPVASGSIHAGEGRRDRSGDRSWSNLSGSRTARARRTTPRWARNSRPGASPGPVSDLELAGRHPSPRGPPDRPTPPCGCR